MTEETKVKLSVQHRLANVRVALNKMKIKKSGKNEFAKYSYYELSDFLPIVTELLRDHLLIAVTSFVPYGDKPYCSMKIIDLEDATQFVEFLSPLVDEAMSKKSSATEIQNLGAIHTYMRRYMYVLAMEISENDMVEATSGAPQKQSRASAKPADKDLKMQFAKQLAESAVRLLGNEEGQRCYAELKKQFGIGDASQFDLAKKDEYSDFIGDYMIAWREDHPEKMLQGAE